MLSETEFEAILADPTKRIVVDVVWVEDPGHPPAREFRVPVESDRGWPLTALGWWQPWPGKLSYGLLHPDADARIIGLDLGYPQHRNPTREFIYGTHKHRWTDAYGGDWAYAPTDITVERDQPIEVWRQFCAEAGIVHRGEWHEPMPPEEGPP